MMWLLKLAVMWWNNWVMLNVPVLMSAGFARWNMMHVQWESCSQKCPTSRWTIEMLSPICIMLWNYCFHMAQTKGQMKTETWKVMGKNVLSQWKLLFIFQCHFCFMGALNWLLNVLPCRVLGQVWYCISQVWAHSAPTHRCVASLWLFWSSVKMRSQWDVQACFLGYLFALWNLVCGLFILFFLMFLLVLWIP